MQCDLQSEATCSTKLQTEVDRAVESRGRAKHTGVQATRLQSIEQSESDRRRAERRGKLYAEGSRQGHIGCLGEMTITVHNLAVKVHTHCANLATT